ncbi:PqiB family protein [Paraferrimonas sedimenticola]|uniref:Multivalent adhesion molecule 7 n=1 Tax=Paraferrimonas sedimenticola TaxID=375674 RepID=A0AA37W111_9GAMM|nr:MlaD family protein [Paraferrimonas sedimenticola]GLP98079.1 multivalent adhesion molecule 7 [Paraferrimonas sedimenticola]
MIQTDTPQVQKKKLISPVWLLPILALILAGYLGFKSYKEAGHQIRIQFPSADGMEVNKTLVKYQGLTVGKVVDISLAEESGVNVDVVMDHRVDDLLNEGTEFWLVAPKASITGVEGLDALFSGNYISMLPGEGSSESFFKALPEAPALLPSDNGIYVRLQTDRLGSINIGSPIVFQQVPVGRVVNYTLTSKRDVVITGFIELKYTHLVRQDSRFWNVSGVSAKADLGGIEVKTESLSTILAGGIAFSSPTDSDLYLPALPKRYRLFESEQESLISGEIRFSQAQGIKAGSQILYRQISIGEVTQVELTDDDVVATAEIFQGYWELIKQDSQFWRQGAEFSLDGIKHPERLITGEAIELLPGTQPLESLDFKLADAAPEQDNKNIALRLYAEQNPGVSAGAKISYKAFPIGEVTKVNLADDLSQVEIAAEIYPEFKRLIGPSSLFLEKSLLQVDASLAGVEVSTGDVTQALSGELELIIDKELKLDTKSGFPVFRNQTHAAQTVKRANYRRIELTSANAADLAPGSSVDYRSMPVGEVERVEWNAKADRFDVTLAIEPTYANLLTPATVFWRHSAVSVEAGLDGIQVDVAPVTTLLHGGVTLGHLSENPDSADKHLYSDQASAMAQMQSARIRFDVDHEFKLGNPVKYQGFEIGKIANIELSPDLQSQFVSVDIQGQYAEQFFTQGTRFYPVSAEIGLGGVENLATLITGSYIGAIPGEGPATKEFFGLGNAPVSSHYLPGLNIYLSHQSLGSVKVGTPIVYRGIAIGAVSHYQLNDQANGLNILVNIQPEFTHLVNKTSRFWNLSGVVFELGLFSGAKLEAGSLDTILAGGIGVATRESNQIDNQLSDGDQLRLRERVQSEWLNWKPELSPLSEN